MVNSLDASVSATLGLDLASANVSGITGTLVLTEASITAAGVPMSQARPAHMSIAQGVLYFDDVAFSAAGEPVMFGGSVAFGDPITLDMTITGTPGLRPFSVLSPQLSVDGLATLNVYLTGPAERPRVTGRIDIESGELVLRDPRVIATDIAGPILFEGDGVSIPGFYGSVNGGSLDASGRITIDGLQATGGEIAVQARGVAIEYAGKRGHRDRRPADLRAGPRQRRHADPARRRPGAAPRLSRHGEPAGPGRLQPGAGAAGRHLGLHRLDAARHRRLDRGGPGRRQQLRPLRGRRQPAASPARWSGRA